MKVCNGCGRIWDEGQARCRCDPHGEVIRFAILIGLLGVLCCLLLSGCGAASAREKCESIYCSHYPKLDDCPYLHDAVVICIEDELAHEDGVLEWFGTFFGGIVDIGKAVVL